jgi:hypothetical protein
MANSVEPIVCPFTVVVDTSEQAPWTLRGISADSEDFITEPANPWTFEGLTANADKKYAPLVVNCVNRSLDTGDYSIEGFEDYITIERKSLSDAFGTFTHDRERWERELDRMRKIPSCHVVIEGSWDDVTAGVMRLGGANIGKAVVRSIFAWSIRFPHVHWWPMGSREMAEATAFRLLEKFWEEDQWQLKELKKLSVDSSSSSRTTRTSKGKGSTKAMF